MRWSDGYVCSKCGVKDEPFKVSSRNLYQCKHCGYQSSVTAGTVLEKTRIPLIKWFWAMFLMGNDKRGCSASQISKQLKLRYDTAWYLCHRIRSAMGERDTGYILSGYIETDDAFFGAPTSNGKRGRGTDKEVVLVGVYLSEEGAPQYVKMEVVPNVKSETVNSFAEKNFKKGSKVTSDGYSSYKSLVKNGFVHKGKICDPDVNPQHLKWLHIIVSNAKAFVMGTFHGLKEKHLQRYLNEFCYRFNRRKFTLQIFNRSLFSCILAPKISYAELTG